MKKKKDLEEKLKKNTEQYNLLKPVFKKKNIHKVIQNIECNNNNN